MATIFLVTPHVAKTSFGVFEDRPFLWDGKTYFQVQEYVDGSHPVESTNFCVYCRSNTCGSLYGDPVCNELN